MNVLLINPPATNIIRESLPPVVEDASGVYPPLGLMYVASYASTVPDCSVTVLDCQAQNIGHEALPAAIAKHSPDVVGIQAMTFTLIDAAMVAKAVRKAAPRARIVFGGPHPTIFPKETLRLPDVDIVVVGEGEFRFAELLRQLQSGREPSGIPGVLTRRDADTDAGTPALTYIEDLDSLAMPARHLVDTALYYSPMATHRRVTTMMSSRGCPFQCVFCDRPQMGKRFRKRSARSVFDEMTYCVETFGIGEIIFYDDTFSVDRQRVLDLCDMINSKGLKVDWDIRARVDTMTPEMLASLKRAGCVRIHYGVETGCQRIQTEIGKNLDLSQIREVFAATRRAGIETLGYFMLGLPTETIAEVNETMDLMTSLPMDYAHISVLTPYPGTKLYLKAIADGTYKTDFWREFALNPTPDFHPRYWNENFTDQELDALIRQAYSRFYRRPRYLLRRLARIRSFGELARKSALGARLLWTTRS